MFEKLIRHDGFKESFITWRNFLPRAADLTNAWDDYWLRKEITNRRRGISRKNLLTEIHIIKSNKVNWRNNGNEGTNDYWRPAII